MKKKTIVILLISIVFCGIAFFTYKSFSYHERMEKLGMELMLKIDSYKERKGHLPKDLSEIGIDVEFECNHYQGGTFYYTITNDSTYWLEFPVDAENNCGISSANRVWKEDYIIEVSDERI